MALNKKALIAWAFYEWASAGFPVIITTFIFATYFTSKIAINEIIGTYQWATATALAGIIIALLGPFFGAIADYAGHHKRWLFLFTFICIVSSALLWFALPDANMIYFVLFIVIIGTISLEIALIFYNSLLPHLSPRNYLGRISGWSWGMGYLGGIIILSIVLFVFIRGQVSWLNYSTFEQIRIAGPITGLWYLVFALPLFLLVPDSPATGLSMKQAFLRGIKDLKKTIFSLPNQPNLLLFLIAHLIYTDGLNTLFAFGGIYAVGTFGMSLSQVVLFGLTMNITAGFGAIAMAWLDDWAGSKPTILISLTGLVTLGFSILFLHTIIVFWCCALALSIFIGPVQAASRSLMARLTPLEKSTEMFGLYAFSGKITAFIGPWLLGHVTYLFGTQRAGMATVIVFFLVGGFLMLFVKEK